MTTVDINSIPQQYRKLITDNTANTSEAMDLWRTIANNTGVQGALQNAKTITNKTNLINKQLDQMRNKTPGRNARAAGKAMVRAAASAGPASRGGSRQLTAKQFLEAPIDKTVAFFKRLSDGDSPCPILDGEDFSAYDHGVTRRDWKSGGEMLEHALKTNCKPDKAQGLLLHMPMRILKLKDKHGTYQRLFHPEELDICIPPTPHEPARKEKCLLFQMGKQRVYYNTALVTTVLAPQDDFLEISIAIYSKENTKETWQSLKGPGAHASFENIVSKAVGPHLAYEGNKPRISPPVPVKEGQPSDPWGDKVRGLFRIKAQGESVALAKSNPNMVINTRFRTDKYAVVNLPRTTNAEEATQASKALGDVSRGIVPNRFGGYGARVLKEDFRIALARLFPDQTTAVGLDLMLMQQEEGALYTIKGAPKSMSKLQMVTVMERALRWPIRPERLNTKGRWYNEHIVFAPTPPRDTQVCIQSGTTIRTLAIYLSGHALKRTAWQSWVRVSPPEVVCLARMQHSVS